MGHRRRGARRRPLGRFGWSTVDARVHRSTLDTVTGQHGRGCGRDGHPGARSLARSAVKLTLASPRVRSAPENSHV